MRLQSVASAVVAGLLLTSGICCSAQKQPDSLSRNVVLIIRHAEKPSSGAGLNAQGEQRAELYKHYFEPFHESGLHFDVDALYAGADSDNSVRPRLTLAPLSKETGLPLDTRAGTKEPEKLVAELRQEKHGSHPLIAWRHGQIPALLEAIGASPEILLPNGKWPDDVYNWVIVLRFDAAGKLQHQERIEEQLQLGPKTK